MGHFSLSIDGDDQELFTVIPAMLCMWSASWVYCYLNHGGLEAFSKHTSLHVFHSIVIVSFSALSIYYNDDNIFPERLGNVFSLCYFLVDFVDCVARRDVPFLIHASLSLLSIGGCYFSPIHQVYRSASKVLLIETSSPLLHLWQKTKTKQDFMIFFLTFTAFRIIWFPIFLYGVFTNPHLPLDRVFYIAASLLPLQLVWWLKMVKMAVNYKEERKIKVVP